MKNNEPDSTSILTAASLFSGLCKLAPIPLLDKFLLRHIKRQMISSILALHDIECKPSDLYPLYKNHHGCLVTLLLIIFFLPFFIIYKICAKIIKWLFFILVIREAALEMGKVILLGHTIERCLTDGRIPVPIPEDRKSYRATLKATVKCKKCFSKAFKGSDWRFLIHLFRGTIKSLKRSPNLIKVTFNLFKKQSSGNKIRKELDAMEVEDRSRIKTLTDEIAVILQNREMQAYLNNFDKMFDKKW
jgi:uncharacterized protein (DUF697 family)